VCDGEQKGTVLKTWYSARNDAAHGLCSRLPSVAWLLRFGRAGEGKDPRSTPLLKNSILVARTCGYAEAQEQACGKQATRQRHQLEGWTWLVELPRVCQWHCVRRWDIRVEGGPVLLWVQRDAPWVMRWGVRSAFRGFEDEW